MPSTSGHAANDGDWRDWSRVVRTGLDRLENQNTDQQKELTDMKIEIAVLKTKVAVWGFIGAAIGTGILNLIFFLVRAKV
jgi:hypothetical protein